MSSFSHRALQQAIFETLSEDAALMALVTGIYDYIPAGGMYPYLALGEMEGRDWSTKTEQGMEFRLMVRVFSREAGRKEAAQIMERVHALLHNADLTVSGHALILMRCESSAIRRENDGSTFQGILAFRALIEAA